MLCESCGCDLIGEADDSRCRGCGIHVCPNCTLIFQHIGDGEHGIGNPEERYATLRARIAELEADKARLLDQREIAIKMLANWCAAIEQNGTGWDDWDECYKDARWRPTRIRDLLDAAIDAAMRGNGEE